MKEFQFDEFNKVFDYNSELWSRFLTSCESNLKSSGIEQNKILDISQSLDLIKAINSYRAFSSQEELFSAYPELIAQKQYVDLLWKHFSSPSTEDLSELAMEMIHEAYSILD